METTAEGQRRGPAGPPRETPQEESRLDLVVWSPPLTVELSKPAEIFLQCTWRTQ
jgi:hypothetical protein